MHGCPGSRRKTCCRFILVIVCDRLAVMTDSDDDQYNPEETVPHGAWATASAEHATAAARKEPDYATNIKVEGATPIKGARSQGQDAQLVQILRHRG
jgi:hypothetical protein